MNDVHPFVSRVLAFSIAYLSVSAAPVAAHRDRKSTSALSAFALVDALGVVASLRGLLDFGAHIGDGVYLELARPYHNFSGDWKGQLESNWGASVAMAGVTGDHAADMAYRRTVHDDTQRVGRQTATYQTVSWSHTFFVPVDSTTLHHPWVKTGNHLSHLTVEDYQYAGWGLNFAAGVDFSFRRTVAATLGLGYHLTLFTRAKHGSESWKSTLEFESSGPRLDRGWEAALGVRLFFVAKPPSS